MQFDCNGHNALAQSLKREGIDFVQADNCFLRIDNMQRAQELADSLSLDRLHKHLDKYAQQLCPTLDVFGQAYHWSIRQIEYSTDLMCYYLTRLGRSAIAAACSMTRFNIIPAMAKTV